MAFEPLYSFLEPVKKYKCNTCEKETLLAVTTNSNWALKRHINSHHSELISQYEDISRKKKSNTPIKSQNSLSKFGFTKESKKQSDLHQSCKVKQEQIDESVINLIMTESLPFTFVKKKAFKELIQTCQPGKNLISYEI